MFKTLFATCLFTFSSCTGISYDYQKKDIRQNAISFSSLYGTYVLRDDFTPYLIDYVNNHQNEGWYSFELNYNESNKQIDGLYSNNGNLDIAYVSVLHIGVAANDDLSDSEINFSLTLNASDTIYTYFDIDNESAVDYNTLAKWINYEVATNVDSIKYHTLYFNGDVNLTGQNFELFNIFYTKDGNSYNTYYNGYYHCINAITWGYFTRFKCQIIVDNVLYAYMSFESDSSWYAIFDYVNQVTVPIYNNGWKVKDMNLYINGMIPNSVYSMLNAKGTFSYVPPQPVGDFSFQDFFFGIADTPLYYAWSLLNWDLFGLNLFVAFCGLCTLALIVFVIKKLI